MLVFDSETGKVAATRYLANTLSIDPFTDDVACCQWAQGEPPRAASYHGTAININNSSHAFATDIALANIRAARGFS